MILLCGIPSEPPLAMVRRSIEDADGDCVVLNQRDIADIDIDIRVAAGRVTGELIVRGQRYRLERFDGVYLRLMDDRFLPEIRCQAPDSPARAHSRRVHEALLAWIEIAPAKVVNRPAAMGSNGSKPYQAQLIRHNGFNIPETLITNDPALVREFLNRCGRIVYKSMSGVRSIVRVLDDQAAAQLDAIRWCPVQFQRYVEGMDVRVHTVGTEAFATSISSDAPDYRYAERETGRAATLNPSTCRTTSSPGALRSPPASAWPCRESTCAAHQAATTSASRSIPAQSSASTKPRPVSPFLQPSLTTSPAAKPREGTADGRAASTRWGFSAITYPGHV